MKDIIDYTNDKPYVGDGTVVCPKCGRNGYLKLEFDKDGISGSRVIHKKYKSGLPGMNEDSCKMTAIETKEFLDL